MKRIVQIILDLAKNSKEIFMSSKLPEKQQLLNFALSNLMLDSEKLDPELKEPFNTFAKMGDQPEWLLEQDNLRTFMLDASMSEKIKSVIGNSCCVLI